MQNMLSSEINALNVHARKEVVQNVGPWQGAQRYQSINREKKSTSGRSMFIAARETKEEIG